jgi:predicted MPP superfamily phosphohydrolase
LIYFSLKSFYAVKGRLKYVIMGVIFVLPPCFIIFSGLTRASDSNLIHWLYLIISSWMGIAIYLVQGFVLAWGFYYFAKKKKWSVKKPYLATTVLSLTAIIIIYGLINAQLLQVKNIDIKIKDLPSEWQDKKILQLSDVHLGSISRVDYLDKIIKKAEEIKPDYIFITGDYLDGTCPRADKFITPLKELSAIAKVYFINGNHETYSRIGNLQEQLEAAGVTMLRDEIVIENGVQIVGLDYTHDRENLANKNTIKQIDKQIPSILLSHEPIYIDEAKEMAVDLHLAGHTHRGQIFPASFVTYLIYGPNHYGLNREGDYSQYTSSGTGTWGPPMRVFTESEMVVFRLK